MTCTVSPYLSTYDDISDIEIVAGATAIQDPSTGETIIVEVHQALWYGDLPGMDHSLINPNQLRHHGTYVQDNPFSAHPLCITQGDVTIPIQTDGTTLFFPCRTPTSAELHDCRHIQLTSDSPWDPRNVQFRPVPSLSPPHTSTPVHTISAFASSACPPELRGGSHLHQRVVAEVLTDRPDTYTFSSNQRHVSLTPDELSERWQISPHQARNTLRVTTQQGIRSALLPLSRRYRADPMFHRPRLQTTIYSDTMFGSHKSIDGNNSAQVFSNSSFFTAVYPMRSKAQAGLALREFIQEYGVMNQLVTDGAKEQTGKNTEMVKQVLKHDIRHRIIEPERYNQNRAESAIRELKRRWFWIMVRKDVPRRLWDYGLRWVSEVMQRTSNSVHSLHGRTPLEQLTGETPDISEYLDFGFYDRVWVRENAGLGEQILCRWLGVSHRVGAQMCYYVLKSNGQVISRSTVQRVTNNELKTDEMKQRIARYDQQLTEVLHEDAFQLKQDAKQEPGEWRTHDLAYDKEFQEAFEQAVGDPNLVNEDDKREEGLEATSYVNVELALPTTPGSEPKYGKVVKRVRGADGMPVGRAHNNPLLDTRQYEIEYWDGHRGTLFANQIAESMYAQVDEEGNRHVMLHEITDHRSNDDAIKKEDAHYEAKDGRKVRKRTTRGWDLLVQWKDDSTTWIPLKDLKESNPIQVAEYALHNRIADEPAFAWWVPYVVKKRKNIISKVKSKYWVTTHKFGIRVPKSVEEALRIDAENHNTLWKDAIKKEMDNVRIAFTVLERGKEEVPPGYQFVKCHMVFDIKLAENFRRKARFVAGGHTTEAPPILTYSSVVSRDSVRIALLVAALNDLQVRAADIQNAYISAPCREKIWTVAGPEFGDEEGEVMLVTRALYGLKSSGAAFRAHLAETLWDAGFRPTRGNNDVHIRPAVKGSGEEYYELFLCYVDDIICISHNAEEVMRETVQEKFKLKNNQVAQPKMYLGSQLQKKSVTGQECWCMSSPAYVNAMVKRVQDQMEKSGKKFPSRVTTPMASGYRPESDASPELDMHGLKTYQEYIGMLRWAVELGRVDIMMEVSMLSSHLAAPREGHLEQAIHIIAYLRKHPKKTIAFDPRHPQISESRFITHDWQEFYRDAQEPVLEDAPKPLGKSVSIHCFVDASHADSRTNRRSQTGVLIFVNRAPVIWFSKRQNTVETSTFGSELVALKIATELIQGLRFKLRSFGIPLEGAANVFCDNEAVTKASRQPETTLAKKHNAVAYHKVREAVAMNMIRVAWEDTHSNLADLLTKPKGAAEREALIDRFMY